MSDEDNQSLDGDAKSLIGAINDGRSRTVVVDFHSGGNNGVVISIEESKKIIAVHAHQVVSGEFMPVGDIGVGYHSEGVVATENEAKVFNSGGMGIPMRAIIHYDYIR
jgi:hypothetical protein